MSSDKEGGFKSKFAPIHCPIGDCTHYCFASGLLMHFIGQHSVNLQGETRIVSEGERAHLVFLPQSIDYDKNFCLGVLLYAGRIGPNELLPALRGLCPANVAIVDSCSWYQNYLPIFIMFCKTTIHAYLEEEEMIEQPVNDPIDAAKHPEMDYYVMWLTACGTTQPCYYTLTLYDQNFSTSRSVIRELRNIKNERNVRKFLSCDYNYLGFNHGDIKRLTGPTLHGRVKVEIILHEGTPEYKKHDDNRNDVNNTRCCDSRMSIIEELSPT